MKVVSVWIAAVMALILALILLCFYLLYQKRMYATNSIEPVATSDSLKTMNIFLAGELEKVRQQLQNYEKTSILQQSQISSN